MSHFKCRFPVDFPSFPIISHCFSIRFLLYILLCFIMFYYILLFSICSIYFHILPYIFPYIAYELPMNICISVGITMGIPMGMPKGIPDRQTDIDFCWFASILVDLWWNICQNSDFWQFYVQQSKKCAPTKTKQISLRPENWRFPGFYVLLARRFKGRF